MIAGILGLDFWESLLSIFLGVVGAGIIMIALTCTGMEKRKEKRSRYVSTYTRPFFFLFLFSILNLQKDIFPFR